MNITTNIFGICKIFKILAISKITDLDGIHFKNACANKSCSKKFFWKSFISVLFKSLS